MFPLSLQLIHSSVVDTAIVFPHRLGLPYKRALKNLIADHLKRIIQDNGKKIACTHLLYTVLFGVGLKNEIDVAYKAKASYEVKCNA